MTSMIAAVARAHHDQQQRERQEQEGDGSSPSKNQKSPVKTVLGALSQRKANRGEPMRVKGPPDEDKLKPRPPLVIEDVPFRRQDRRVLNSRKKRMMDRKLIRCLLGAGLLMVLVGGTLVALWWQLEAEEPLFGPFILVGAVLIFFGVMIMFFSLEICSRLKRNVKRVQDPEIDSLTNLHHIKHWIDPTLIPYGWGQNEEGDEDEDTSRRVRRVGGGAADSRHALITDHAELASSRGGAGCSLNMVHPVDTSASVDEDNPHHDLALQMLRDGKRAPTAEEEDDDDITSDIFDESMRYSDVNRPSRIKIEHASPTRRDQIRGEFQTEEERIAKIFPTKNKNTAAA